MRPIEAAQLWPSAGAAHVVQFYEDGAFLTDTVAGYLAAGLSDGAGALVVATAEHREAIAERLRARDVDLKAAEEGGRYSTLDAGDALASFMHGGEPDPQDFATTVGSLIERLTAGPSEVRVFGEMVALLAAAGYHSSVLRLEALWNELLSRLPFMLLCAYPIGEFNDEAHGRLLSDVCEAHARVIPAESYTAAGSPEAQVQAIAELQQKAAWLEAQLEERERAQARLQQALAAERAAHAAAEAAARSRVEFLSIASHELRTPLTSLLGFAQAMHRRVRRGDPLSPASVEQFLGLLVGRGEQLTRLVNELLDVAQLEAATLVLDRAPTDVATLVRRATAEASGWSTQHLILLDAPPSLPAEVDAERLSRLLLGLIENAVRYSPDGGAVEVLLRRLEPSALLLSVRDHGLGIPPEKRSRLFEPFFQAHGDDHRSGVGLGLYLSRRIAELHGGSLDVAYPPDGGLQVEVRLPLNAEMPLR
jgi:signal transduction histidine kinase